TQADDQAGAAQPIAVISHDFWRRRFGADPAVVGKSIKLEDVQMTIVGVTPPGFFGIEVGANPDLWWPIHLVPQVETGPWKERLNQSESWWMRIMGRVAPGASRERAQAELDLIFQRQLAEFIAAKGARWSDDIHRFVRERNLELAPGGVGWTSLRHQFS